MRRQKTIISVAACAAILLGAILVARGQDGDPFPPPPIVPPNEPGALPDVEMKSVRLDQDPHEPAESPPTLPNSGKEKPQKIVRVVPVFPKPQSQIPKQIDSKVKLVETQLPLPEFPGAPKKETAQEPSNSVAAVPPPDFPTPPIPFDAKSSNVDKSLMPDVQPMIAPKKESTSPLGDLAPKAVPMFPKPAKAPPPPVPPNGAPNKKTQVIPEVPAPPEIPNVSEIGNNPKPELPATAGVVDITPKPIGIPVEKTKSNKPAPQIEQPGENVEPTPPVRPSFQIISPLRAKRPARHVTTESNKRVYSKPAEKKVSGSNVNGSGSNKTPSLVIEKTGPSSVLLGQSFHYEISVRNLSSEWAHGAMVEDELPYGVRFQSAHPEAKRVGKSLVWRVDVPPKTARQFRVEVEPTAAGNWTNNARVTVSAKQSFETSIEPTSLIVRVNCPKTAELNDMVEFGVHVTNASDKDMSNLLIVAELSAGLEHSSGKNIEGNIGNLPAGESTIVTLKAKAVEHRAQYVKVTIRSESGQQAQSKATIKIGKSGLDVKMTAPAELNLNREGDLIVDVVNLRNHPVRNVVVRSQLPAGLQYISASDEGLYRKGTHAVDWIVPQLQPGQVRRLAMKVRADAPGEYAPVVVAHAESGSETQSRQTVRIAESADLHIAIQQNRGPVRIGQKRLFVIDVVNNGSMPATNVNIRAKLPQGLTLWQTSGATRASYQNGIVIFQPVANIAPGEKVAFGVTVVARQAGAYPFAVQTMSDQMNQPVVTEAHTVVTPN